MSTKINEGIGCVKLTEHSYGMPDNMSCMRGKVVDHMVASHPLELTIDNFAANEQRLRLLNTKMTQGIHLPLRLNLEQKIVKQNSGHHSFLPSSQFSLDILTGSHETIGFEDILNIEEFKETMARPHDDLEVGFK
uniref:Proteasome maturation protein n=1 Tax=Cacopsylla melanoneura TaxID=428564 RepID=A0A8D8WFJ6_9HEMI